MPDSAVVVACCVHCDGNMVRIYSQGLGHGPRYFVLSCSQLCRGSGVKTIQTVLDSRYVRALMSSAAEFRVISDVPASSMEMTLSAARLGLALCPLVRAY